LLGLPKICHQIQVTGAGAESSWSSLEKEFKDRHRGDLSRSRFIKAKQRCTFRWETGPTQGVLQRTSQNLELLLGTVDTGAGGMLIHEKLDYVSLTFGDWVVSSTAPTYQWG
jgi:hypothetical protein